MNGDVPSLLHEPSFFDQEGDEPGGYVLPEFGWDSSFLPLIRPLVSLSSAVYRASRSPLSLLLSSGVVSSCVASLQYGAFRRYFSGFFTVLGVGLAEAACDFVCSVKSGQDNGAVDGEVGARSSGEPWAYAVVNELVAVHAASPMSFTLSGRGKKRTAVFSCCCSTPIEPRSRTARTLRLHRFLLVISSCAQAICSCSLRHPFATAFHRTNSRGWGQVEFPQVEAVWG